MFDCFASLAHGNFDEFGPTGFHYVGNAVQNLRAFVGRSATPRAATINGFGNDRGERRRARDCCGIHLRSAAGRPVRCSDNRCAPGPVRRDGRVGVGSVVKLTGGDALALRGTVWCGNCVVQRVHRRDKTVVLTIEKLCALEFEHGRHKVVAARSFVESPNEVGDRHIELGGVHNGRVQEQTSRGSAHRFSLAFRHSEKHFEFNSVAHSALTGECPRKRDVEEVVPGNADSDVIDSVGRERVVENSLVVGVRLLLGAHGGQLPPVEFRINLFHRKIRTLDNAHLDGGAAARTAVVRPFLQANHRAERVGQIGLKNNPGFEVQEFVAIKNPLEHRNRHIEVVVLLHVEVDELRGICSRGEPIHRQERFDHVVDRFSESPRRVGRNGGGNLHRYVVDIGSPENL